MFDLETIKHMNKPAQVRKQQALARAMNKADTQKSRQCVTSRKTPPTCGHQTCFDKWNRFIPVIAAVFLLFLAGCQKSGQSKEKTSNSEFKVTLLFEHDGVKVYRFYDGRDVYYTDARGQTAWQQSCGKNCSRPVSVETVK